MNEIEICSSFEVINAKKIEYRGFLIHNNVKNRNMFSNFGAEMKTLVGGKINGLSELTADVRSELLKEIKNDAAKIAANAIVEIRFETTEIIEMAIDIVVYGTAAYFER